MSQSLYQGFIARQAVFDAERNIWGYEILYRQISEAAQDSPDHRAMLEVATRAFLNPRWQQSPDSFLVVTLEPLASATGAAGVLPKGKSVLLVSEDALNTLGMPELLSQLRQENYLIGLGDFSGVRTPPALLELIDIIAVDMQRADRHRLISQARKGSRPQNGHVLAKKVEDVQTFSEAKAAGCTLFQGFFFQKPERISSKILSSNLAASVGVLNMVEQETPDLDALAKAIKKDAALGFRLLKFLNSPYFGFAREVSSIKTALIMAGWSQMRTWLRLVLITEMKPRQKPSELVFLSAQRGRFLELVARKAAGKRLDSERLLLLGLFSLLDSMFDMRMEDVVDSLPLDQELKDTLCRRATAFSPWLGLVSSFEHADWPQIHAHLKILGVDPVEVAESYTESMRWAHSVFNFLG